MNTSVPYGNDSPPNENEVIFNGFSYVCFFSSSRAMVKLTVNVTRLSLWFLNLSGVNCNCTLTLFGARRVVDLPEFSEMGPTRHFDSIPYNTEGM